MFEKIESMIEIVNQYNEVYKTRIGTTKYLPINYSEEIASIVFAEQKKEFKRLNVLIENIEKSEQKKIRFFNILLKRNRKRLKKSAKMLKKVELSILIKKLIELDGQPDEPVEEKQDKALEQPDRVTQGDYLDG